MGDAGARAAVASEGAPTLSATSAGEAVSGARRATIVVVTRNRRDEVLRALASCDVQSEPAEAIVVDDGSTDGTADAVRAAYPTARVVRFEQRRGYIACRNHAFAIARGEIVFSLDDDASFTSADTVARTLADFSHERVGVVALSISDNGVPANGPPACEGDEIVVPRFIGAGFAIRRSCFSAAGGFPEVFVHQGEEAFLCLRLLALGYVVKLGTAVPVDHRPSATRDVPRWDYYGSRNDVLLGALALPTRELPGYAVKCGYRLARCLYEQRRFRDHLRGATDGVRDAIRQRSQRDPVPVWAAQLDRRLLARKRFPLEEALRMIPDGVLRR